MTETSYCATGIKEFINWNSSNSLPVICLLCSMFYDFYMFLRICTVICQYIHAGLLLSNHAVFKITGPLNLAMSGDWSAIMETTCHSLSQPGASQVAWGWNLALKLEINALESAPAGYD